MEMKKEMPTNPQTGQHSKPQNHYTISDSLYQELLSLRNRMVEIGAELDCDIRMTFHAESGYTNLCVRVEDDTRRNQFDSWTYTDSHRESNRYVQSERKDILEFDNDIPADRVDLETMMTFLEDFAETLDAIGGLR